MKYKLYLVNKDNTEDIFKFNSMKDLFEFLNKLMEEKLIDSKFVEMEYYILVED